ncbi:MAG: recombination protein RecR [Alphaproteobacteria bacterium]|nr:recombination protein RecR [Alphaproteobacteria bacterium]
MQEGDIERLTTSIARLPGMGTRSANRLVLHLLRNKNSIFRKVIEDLQVVYQNTSVCSICGNIDTLSPCSICQDKKRDKKTICVVSDVTDVWSIERASFYRGLYHVIGGKLSAIDGVTPADLNVDQLRERIETTEVDEVIIAMSADIDGQTTMHFINNAIKDIDINITTLACGMPIGGELENLDDGTIMTAFNQRKGI